jgi:phenylacetic acid degradation protein
MPCYQLDGIRPVVHPNAFVHPTAVLIGDVHIGELCYVGPNASLRGDFGRIIMKQGSNIQDNCVVHGFPRSDTLIEINGHVGHGAVLHGCIVGEDSLIGMNSVILDNANIAPRSLVGAGSIVKANFTCEESSLIIGSPAKVIRKLSNKEIKWKQMGTEEYQTLSKRCLKSLEECLPLPHAEENRKRMDDFIENTQLAPKN